MKFLALFLASVLAEFEKEGGVIVGAPITSTTSSPPPPTPLLSSTLRGAATANHLRPNTRKPPRHSPQLTPPPFSSRLMPQSTVISPRNSASVDTLHSNGSKAIAKIPQTT